MSVLVDASTIFLALITRRTVHIAGSSTLDLARYELGNAALRQLRSGILSEEEAMELAEASSSILRNMVVLQVEDEPEALRLAASTDLTFYDASYLHTAERLGLNLATEDARLARAAKHVGVQPTSLAELI
ncbi:MAG TPA: type II toxin-antitoxin system VapC family toxin [Candidatus Bathyarchaeia archaeon]